MALETQQNTESDNGRREASDVERLVMPADYTATMTCAWWFTGSRHGLPMCSEGDSAFDALRKELALMCVVMLRTGKRLVMTTAAFNACMGKQA